MHETLIVSRTELETKADLERVHHFQAALWEKLRAVAGYLGSGSWIASDGRLTLLALHRYRDTKSAEKGLKIVSQNTLSSDGAASGSAPVDAIRTKTIESSGMLGDHILSSPYVSLTVRIAEPGQQCDLVQSLRDVLTECAAIDGFTGYRIAASETLQEEIFSLAGWTSREAFLKSIPQGLVPTVRCFKLAWSTVAAPVSS